MLFNYFLGKVFQHLFSGDVTDEVFSGLYVNDGDSGTMFPELFGDALSNAVRSSRDHCHLVLKVHVFLRFFL